MTLKAICIGKTLDDCYECNAYYVFSNTSNKIRITCSIGGVKEFDLNENETK